MRVALLVVTLAACQQELGRPPVPRFEIEPAYVPLDDDFRTEVTLDASASADELDDPASPLGYAWAFDDDRIRVVRGDPADPTIAITAPGDRPVTIALTVEDTDGQRSTLEQRLGVSVPEDP
ncbi:MAG: hypothetical protein HYY06_15880 [Deltaproteobacteria bacterium]|nr:hypothetical protein [Deltaproteobacteria bacterium]